MSVQIRIRPEQKTRFLGGVSSIVVAGCSHSSAPLPLLERLSIPASQLEEVYGRLASVTSEGAVLSTCNRTEIYAVMDHAGSGDAVLALLAERAGLTIAELRPHAYTHTDGSAVRHALSVASGLDSMVLGEDQIQAQWKRALAHARAAQALGPMLERLGTAALACGKRVRAFTGVGRHAVSLESLAVRASVARLGTLDHREVLIIGAGDSAGLIARHARSSGAARITVMSRSRERAEAFAHIENVRAESIESIVAAVARADAIFCCTSAPHPVLGTDHFTERVATRPEHPVVCVDLGMPRDVDESVERIASVQMVRLEELAGLADSHRAERREHVPAAEAIVSTEVARFLEWQRSRGSAATIARLQWHAQQIADLEIDIALARLAHLPLRDREIVAGMAHRIVKKLMHTPTTALKQHPEGENLALALAGAFRLPGGSS